MKSVGSLIVTATCFLAFCNASAGFPDPKLTMHMVEGSSLPSDCSAAPTSPACNNWGSANGSQIILRTQGDLDTDYTVYILLADVDSLVGLREIQFGMSYEAGVTVSAWQSCAGDLLISHGWPVSGGEATLHFDDCARPIPDEFDLDHRGVVSLLALTVKATTPALLRLVDTSEGFISITNCDGVTTELAIDFGYGEIGFGYKVGWDPCNWNPFAHDDCEDSINCACCYPGGCSIIAPYNDARACRNRGGEIVIGLCEDCGVPSLPVTWGLLKTRFQ